MRSFCAILLITLTVGCERASSTDRPGVPKHVLIIRHAEKPPEEAGELGLNAKGKIRAAALYELFEASDQRTDSFPKPDFLFAAAKTKKSYRSVETLAPLGKKLRLTVNEKYDGDDFANLTREIFGKPKYAGKTVLICWKHHAIPDLAAKLGATDAPKNWKDDVFDRVWQLDFDDGNVKFRDRPQELK